jgi:hypothetical protein
LPEFQMRHGPEEYQELGDGLLNPQTRGEFEDAK